MFGKTIIIPVIAVLVVSCIGDGRQQVGQGTGFTDNTVREEKQVNDSIMNEVFASLTDIADNLNTIKIRENLITSSYTGGDVPMEPTAVILSDIAAIDDLLAENRRAIERLQHSAAALRNSNSAQVTSLERLLSALADQVAAKDREIDALKEELRFKSERVETLTGDLDEVSRIKGELETDLAVTTDMLNTVYYIVGTAKELKEKGITGKSGFIGRTTVLTDSHELDNFTVTDMRTFDELILGRKNVEVVTNHPEGSYVFVMGDKGVYQSLVITDKARFWSTSKALVVSYK